MSNNPQSVRHLSPLLIPATFALGLAVVAVGCGSSEEETENWESTPTATTAAAPATAAAIPHRANSDGTRDTSWKGHTISKTAVARPDYGGNVVGEEVLDRRLATVSCVTGRLVPLILAQTHVYSHDLPMEWT